MKGIILSLVAVLGIFSLEALLSISFRGIFIGALGKAFLKILSYSPILIYAFAIKKFDFEFFGFSKKTSRIFLIKSVTLLIFLFLLCKLLVEIELVIINGVDNYLKNLNQIFGWSKNLIDNFITLLLIGPIVEEIFFRGILLNKSFTTNKVIGLYFTSFLFALMHLKVELIFSSFTYSFILGLFLGSVMLKTNHLGYVIILHILWNFLNYILPLLLSIINIL